MTRIWYSKATMAAQFNGEELNGITSWLSCYSKEFLNKKLKSPLFPVTGGGGVVTNDLRMRAKFHIM